MNMNMNRRIVSIILLPWVLLTQSVAFGHAHEGNQPVGNSLRTHIHIDHAHNHQHGSHSHNNGDNSEHEKQRPLQVEPLFDHDASAVFISSLDVISGSRSTIKTEIKVLFQWDIIGCNSSSEFPQLTETGRSVLDCAPPDSDSPLFVRHHAYLI